MEANAHFKIQQCPSMANQLARMQNVPYSEAIGSVLWPVVVSRPDVAYAVGTLLQFIQNLGPAHLEALKHIISYLESMKELWLTFGGKTEMIIEVYCNADWASQQHRHSILCFSFHFGEGVVSWSLKKQNMIALLSTEAEYIAQMHVEKEAVWLWNFGSEVQGKKEKWIILLCNNQGAITLAKDNKFHSRTKNIDLCYCHGPCSVTFFLKNNQRTAPMESPMMAALPLFGATVTTGHPHWTYIGAPLEYFLYSDTTNKPAFLSLSLPTSTMCYLLQHNQSPTMLHTHSMFQANVMVRAWSCSFRRTIKGRL